MPTIHFYKCPCCHSNSIEKILSARDFTVSGEQFEIWQCWECTLRFTQDIPDQQSIGRYYASEKYISHSDIDKGMINRIYRWVRKRTLSRKRKWVIHRSGVEKGALLDYGSGTGYFVNEMKQHGWSVIGLEPDADARKLSKQLHKIEADDTALLFEMKENVFDAITLWHVLEHVHDLHRTVDALKDRLKPGGRLFVAVPNYTSADAERYLEYWAAYDVPRHLYHFSPASMERLAAAHGMLIENYQPMWYDSYYISLMSSKYKTGKTKFFSAMMNGWRSNFRAKRDHKKCSSLVYVMRKN